jgi:hypothetical protein
MRCGVLFVTLLALLQPAVAAPRKSKPAAKAAASRAVAAKTPAAPKLMQNCDAHKFETLVDTTVDGQPHQSKVKLCGVDGQSDAAWIETLRDAVRKLQSNKGMVPAQRDQITSAIKAEIARLSVIAAAPPAPFDRAPPAVPTQPQTSLARDYAALPPLPSALPPPEASVQVDPGVPVASPQSAATSVPLPVPAKPAIVSAPKLTFKCYTPGELGGEAPCFEFQRETMLIVGARDKLPAGASLRFVRNGETRAEVDLGSMADGKPMRMALPREVCSGFGAGRLELVIAVNGSIARTEGPFPLRCY